MLASNYLFILCVFAFKFALSFGGQVKITLDATTGTGLYLGNKGESCFQTCFQNGLNCNPVIQTNNSPLIFKHFKLPCDYVPSNWNSFYEPAYNPNTRTCSGYMNVPASVTCSGENPEVQRICNCQTPIKGTNTLGVGLSNGFINGTEQWIFSQVLATGDTGVMSHLWLTYPQTDDPTMIIRYYIDGEKNASIQFEPSFACGVGFSDDYAPWGLKWFGKGAKFGSWYFNFKIPFTKSVVVTAELPNSYQNGFYMIVRGSTNTPIKIGDVSIPSNARLNLFTTNQTFTPLEWITLANVPSNTQGFFFMLTLSVQSKSINFLEGCFHAYTANQNFPGTLLSTGTEDYFDSGWYFDAGAYRLPVSGLTFFNSSKIEGVQMSAYRFHEMDPVLFSDGFQLVWRNGDTVDQSGIKCLSQEGIVVGAPENSFVKAYTWVYTWN